MLASITTSLNDGNDVVTVQLPDGRKIVGLVDSEDNIQILENTTHLEGELAECAAGIALVKAQDDGDEVMVWRRLVQAAEKCQKRIAVSKLKLN